jgi:serine/threonine protein kinase
MTPERWQRIEQIYFAALARAPGERAALLDEACRGDEALRREIDSLLDAHHQASGFLAQPAMEVVAKRIALEPTLAKAGQVINQYQVLSPLGAGGMGVVYKALDLKLGRTVALKMLAPALVSNEAARLRFLREARAASMLAHPGICTVFEVGQSEDLIYIAMQYLQGKTLSDLLAESHLPIETALSYALDIADALKDAHQKGVIHRDIKPTNIIVNERGRAVVLDFGLAKYIGANRAYDGEAQTLLQITETMSPIGTPAYMSPEQARGGRLDERSDIFSFGVMLYEMVTGVRPFRGQSHLDTLHAILYEEPASPLEVNPEIPDRLDGVIRKTLAKDPRQRYQSFAELQADLAGVLSDKSAQHSAPRPAARFGETPAPNDATVTDGTAFNVTAGGAAAITQWILRPVSGRRSVAILGAALLLTLAGWFVWWLSGTRSSSDLIASLKQIEVVNWKEQGGQTSNLFGGISPDGKMIAYSSKSDGHGNIWVKQTSAGDPVQITKDNWNNWSPIWSPDGQELAYLSRRGQQTGIWRIAAFGGVPKLVATLDTLGGLLKGWSQESETIYYRANGNFFAIDVASGQSKALTQFDVQDSPAEEFSISPAEDRIAYDGLREHQKDIWVMPVGSDSHSQITNDPEEDRFPVWHPDGKRIFYSSKRNGVYQVCVAFLDSRKNMQLTFGDSDCFVSGVTEDGTKIAVSSPRQYSDLWAVDANTGEETQTTDDVHAEMWADISPDSRQVLYQFMRYTDDLEGSQILLKQETAGEQQIELATRGIEPRWSPDGRAISFLRLDTGVLSLWSINASGTSEKQLTPRPISGFNWTINPYNRFHTSEFSWSPDSRWIAFTTATAEPGIWIVGADGQSESRALPAPDADTSFYSPLWSPDAKRIAYLSRAQTDTQAIWKVSIVETGTGRSRTVHQSKSVLRLLGWSASGSELVVATVHGKAMFASAPANVGVFEVSADRGSVRHIVTAETGYLYNNQLSPDRRSIAIASRRDGKDNIWLYPMTGGDPKKITSNSDSRLFLSSLTWSPDGQTICFAKQACFGVMSIITNYR